VSEKGRVLVVDDSAIDRRLAGALLKKHGYLVDFAEDGLLALEKIASEKSGEPPLDAIVTDLHMPNMTGLELVVAVRGKKPKLPVILMTAHGSEEIAVLALRTGAASFVPKRLLSAELGVTVDAMIALSRGVRYRDSLREERDDAHAVYTIDNDMHDLHEAVGKMEAQLQSLGFCDETGVLQVGVALREAIVNAVCHGNLEVPSELKDGGSPAFQELAAVRRGESPYKERRVIVEVRRQGKDAIEYVVKDEGPGFDPSLLPDPTDPTSIDKEHGRGIMLMRMFMDEVEHRGRGNEVRMLKRRGTTPVS
jgi:CheY-like chemotaxis protein